MKTNMNRRDVLKAGALLAGTGLIGLKPIVTA
ncbi:twin-arginine translocation signal domain-containing protein [Mucilaginibacter sp. AW1-3]